MIRAAATAAALSLAALSACAPTTPAGGGAQGGVPLGPYFLVGIGADAVPERNATLVISKGSVTGTGPCNSFTATNTGTPPTFALSNFSSTRANCKEAALESRYFAALQQASAIEYDGGLLIIQGPTWLQFEAGYPAK